MEHILPDYTRVTTILSIFQNYANVDKKKLKESQDIGTLLHDEIKKYLNLFQKSSDECYFSNIPYKWGGYWDSFLSWKKNINDLEVILSERRLYDPLYKITGQIDLVAKIDGKSHIIDFKFRQNLF